MCGRYSLITSREDLAASLGVPLENVLDSLTPRYNIAPSQPVPTLIDNAGMRMALFRWGLIPPWAKDPGVGHRMINARRETLAERPSFRDAFRRQRCLVVADGFYEWKAAEKGRPKIPHYIRLASRKPFTFAGLWSRWSDRAGPEVLTCAIITGDASEPVSRIHHRMPVIIPPENREAWLDPEHRSQESLFEVLRAADRSPLEIYPVSRYVNSPDHEGERCIEELRDPEEPSLFRTPGPDASA